MQESSTSLGKQVYAVAKGIAFGLWLLFGITLLIPPIPSNVGQHYHVIPNSLPGLAVLYGYSLMRMYSRRQGISETAVQLVGWIVLASLLVLRVRY